METAQALTAFVLERDAGAHPIERGEVARDAASLSDYYEVTTPSPPVRKHCTKVQTARHLRGGAETRTVGLPLPQVLRREMGRASSAARCVLSSWTGAAPTATASTPPATPSCVRSGSTTAPRLWKGDAAEAAPEANAAADVAAAQSLWLTRHRGRT